MNRQWLSGLALGLLLLLLANLFLLTRLTLTDDAEALDPDGKVDVLLVVEPGCADCFDPQLFLDEIEAFDVVFGDIKTVKRGTRAGERAITDYGLTTLPTIILSKELSAHNRIVSAWGRIGTIVNGEYLLPTPPPYYDIGQASFRGAMIVTYLVDSSCDECYDVFLHRTILDRVGMFVVEERTVELRSEEGAALVGTYSLKAAPTVIIEGEAELYPGFTELWEGVGTSADGISIFTNLAVLGSPYIDIASGNLVRPSQ